jgi:hypothetical protein
MLQNGVVPEDIADADLEKVTAMALDLARAFDLDVGQAAAAAGQLIRTGLVDNATEAFDVMTRGFQQGANKADDLLETLTEYGTLFREAGISAKVATGLMVQGLSAGARDADKVADAIKEFTIRGKDGSKATAEGFKALGLSSDWMAQKIAAGGDLAAEALDETLDALRDVHDPVKRNAIAVALFGTQAEDLGQALYALDPSTAVAALGQVGGAAEAMGDTLNDNASTKIEAFKRTMQMYLVDFIDEKVIPAAESLKEWWDTDGQKWVEDFKAGLADLRAGWDGFLAGLDGLGPPQQRRGNILVIRGIGRLRRLGQTRLVLRRRLAHCHTDGRRSLEPLVDGRPVLGCSLTHEAGGSRAVTEVKTVLPDEE